MSERLACGGRASARPAGAPFAEGRTRHVESCTERGDCCWTISSEAGAVALSQASIGALNSILGPGKFARRSPIAPMARRWTVRLPHGDQTAADRLPALATAIPHLAVEPASPGGTRPARLAATVTAAQDWRAHEALAV
jgi:hypothetical protein